MSAEAQTQPWPSKDDVPALREYVASQEWYHTLELAPGITTPGFFDHKPLLPKLPWPASLAGKRCLDIATFDGFWAFEMERRGADEVIAIDILDPWAWDWPAGTEKHVVEAIDRRKRGGNGFLLAKDMLGSAVTRLERSVYELDPDDVGKFDFVFLGSLLMHIRNPVGALERIRSVCSGQFVLMDNIHLPFTIAFPNRPVATLDAFGRPWWWKCNLAGLRRMTEAAGFETVSEPRRIYLPSGPGEPRVRPTLGLLRHFEGRAALFRTWYGDPHAVFDLRPAA